MAYFCEPHHVNLGHFLPNPLRSDMTPSSSESDPESSFHPEAALDFLDPPLPPAVFGAAAFLALAGGGFTSSSSSLESRAPFFFLLFFLKSSKPSFSESDL